MPISSGGGAGQYPIIMHPGQQRFIFSQEDTSYGTPSTVVGKTFLEPCNSITTAIQRQPYEAREYAGVPADLFDMIETTHHSTVTISTPWRANGIGAWALAAIMGSSLGGAADANATNVSGYTTVLGFTVPTGSIQHYINANNSNNICNTFSIYHDAGDGQYTNGQRGLLRIPSCTVESIRLTFTPNTALMCEITFQGNFPKFRATSGSSGGQNQPPAGYIRLTGGDATYKGTRLMGFQGVQSKFLLQSSNAVGNVQYSNQILSGDLTITRPIEVIESPYSQDPVYYLPGPLTITGTMNMLFDGLGPLGAIGTGSTISALDTSQNEATGANAGLAVTNSIYQDYLAFKRTGTSTAPNEIRYVDNDGNGFDLTFYPIKWSSFGLNASAQSLQVNAGFTSFNDLAAAAPPAGTTSKISAVEHVYIVNNVPATTMIA